MSNPISPMLPTVSKAAKTTPTEEKPASSPWWDKDGMSFGDFLDTINPLQHLPVIATFYRKITGDGIGYAAQLTGDGLYGGLMGGAIGGVITGVASAFANMWSREATGKDIGENVLTALQGGGAAASAQVAQGAPEKQEPRTGPETVAPTEWDPPHDAAVRDALHGLEHLDWKGEYRPLALERYRARESGETRHFSTVG